ncbi:uncharacterized protein LOC143036609 [Oratosquilla oratoria]|uniref:uncharacterized protein LOC143036609 n=1 Tax=Oratosquilla oratoria TaxID=337810 RepID=UPI003F777B67
MAKRQRSALTVERVLELLFDEDEEEDTAERADVIIVPPDVDELTDEEDIAEDEVGEISIQDVPGTLEVHVDRMPIEEHAENKAKAGTSSRKKPANFVTLNPYGSTKLLNTGRSKGVPNITGIVCRK